MDKLKINFENCFGIGKLTHEFDFKKSKTILIYAPNGTMKTSFAKTFDLISKNDSKNPPCDRIYKSRITKYEVTTDESKINPNSILVINAEDNNYDASNKISTFLASQDLKTKYDEIYTELNKIKAEFVKKLKTISQSTDCETEFINTFSEKTDPSFFEVLLNQINNLKDKFDKSQFRYNDVFDNKGNVKKFLEKNQNILDQYINSYKSIISKSNFFKESANNTFGTYQANEIIKSIEDNSFFEAGHKFILENGIEVNNSEELKKIVQEEIQSILNDEKLKLAFEKVDKAIGANIQLRAFKNVIEKDNLILVKLKDYEKFKQEVWLNYFSEIKQDAIELTELYKKQKKKLEKIISDSKKEFALWTKIIKTFNSRFYVPFQVIIANQEDIILKKETANLKFDYSDRNEKPVTQKREELLKVLSKGEQRAYFILQFLFEIESRKLSTEKNLLIFDDISDSFDYKNKYAIIEYIKETHQNANFRTFILTHNFDFYRTVASRLNLDWNVVFMATKSESKKITLHKGQYRNDIFDYFIKNYSKPKVFISLISFVRNLIEYSESKTNPEYLTLTNCLHRKEVSDKLSTSNIFDIYKNRLVKLNDKTISFGNQNIIQFIINTANNICIEDNVNEIIVENKIPLAIAIRLKAEEYLIKKMPELDLNSIKTNQTRALYDKYLEIFPESKAIDILDKVNLMTPENIHINAFMFEPLIDMSVHHLINLYNETNNLKL
jgi:ABC-type cobalamin/Fe3+-siderophores transport system ATPase subunit